MKKQTIFFLMFSLYVLSNGHSQSLSLPYYTGFDSVSEQAGWEGYILKDTATFGAWAVISINLSYSPPSLLFHDYNLYGTATDSVDDWFVSPPLKFNTQTQLDLKIYITYASESDYIGIWYGTGSNDPTNGNFYELADLTNMQPYSQWLDTSITFNAFADSGYITFRYKTINNYFQIGIDNVNIVPSSSKGTIDSIKIIPSNPTTNDSIKIIAFSSFPNGACSLKNSSFNINSKKIVINATHIEGDLPTTCNSIDTIIIGKLDTGAYTLFYNLSVDTNLAVFDTDTLFFVVQNSANVFDLSYKTSQIKIYPNPFIDEITLKFNRTGKKDIKIRIYNVLGESVHEDIIPQNQDKLNLSDLPAGIYLLQLEGEQIIRKKIIKL